MRRGLVAVVSFVAALACIAAASTGAQPSRETPRVQSPARGSAVRVTFAIQKFKRSAGKLVAQGAATATYTGPDGQAQTAKQPFTAKVIGRIPGGHRLAGARQTCQVLYLQLDKLSLTLLGLDVNLDKVVLTINASSDGGALGSLFCKLAHTKVKTRVLARHLTSLARQSGLATTTALGFSVPLSPSSAAAGALSCPVLDLILGPLNLRLLGLIVTLNQVHLTITADPTGGALGALFCALSKASVTGVP